MEHLKMHSKDKIDDNVSKIAALFPNCVTEAKDENGEIKGLNPSKTFLSNKYKIEVGTIKYENQYESYTVSGYTSAQDYHVGDPATGNVNAQMFGVLNLDDKTLSYDVYTVNSDEVKLFDSLDIMKD